MMGMKGADLTDEQQEQLAELHGEQAKQQFTLMQKMQEPRQNLQELMNADELDIDAISQAYDELADVRKEALMTRLKNEQKMQEIMEKKQSNRLTCELSEKRARAISRWPIPLSVLIPRRSKQRHSRLVNTSLTVCIGPAGTQLID